MYIGFVVTYSILAVSLIDFGTFQLQRSTHAMIDGILVGQPDSLSNVSNVPVFWNYFNNTLLKSIFAKQLSTLSPIESTYPPVDVLSSNYVVGDILLYSWRVLGDGNCPVKDPFSEYLDKCFQPSGPASATTYGTPNQIFSYTSETDIPIHFPPLRNVDVNSGGFFVALSSNSSQAFQAVDSLMTNSFIDPTSNRIIAIFFTLFNANFRLFQSVQILFEISPTQYWTKPLVYLSSFPYWLTPSLFGENLDSSILALFIVTCVFILSSVVVWTISAATSREKIKFFWSKFGILSVLLVAITSVVLLASLLYLDLGRTSESFTATVAERQTVSPFTFFLNSGDFAYKFDVLRTIFAINLMLIYIQIVVQIGHIFFLPSLRVLVAAGTLIVCYGFAFHLILPSTSVSHSLYETSLLWLSDWSNLTANHIGRLLLYAFFSFLMFGCFVYLWSALCHVMLAYRESSEDSLDKQVEKFFSSLRGTCKEYYEYLVFERFNLDDTFKTYLPGFYYRVIVEERRFQQKVQDTLTQKSLNRNRRAGFIASDTAGRGKRGGKIGSIDLDKTAAELQKQDQVEENLEMLDDSAAKVHGRMIEVDEELSAQLQTLSKQIAEIEKYITILDRKISQ